MTQDTCEHWELLRYHVALYPTQKEGPIWDSGFAQASYSHQQKNRYE